MRRKQAEATVQCWMVARWRRIAGEDSARLCCREFREGNRDQTEHPEQLPGVNYIMSRDREASKRCCCAVCRSLYVCVGV